MQSLFSELPHSATHADTFKRGGERERAKNRESERAGERMRASQRERAISETNE